MEKHVESVELLETLLTFACAAEKFGERVMLVLFSWNRFF